MVISEYNKTLRSAHECLRIGDAKSALRLAREASSMIKGIYPREYNLGAFEIDAGAMLNNRRIISRAIKRLERIKSHIPESAKESYNYNLGNGYLAIGERERGHSPGTRPSLSQAVSFLEESLVHCESTEARTNLGSALLSQGRWVEALDEFSMVLRSNPKHHNALAMHGSALMGLANWSRNHKGLMVAALNDHRLAAKFAKDEPAYRKSYLQVVSELERAFRPARPKRKRRSHYQNWIWTNRLNLNLCPICELSAPGAFDSYPLQGPILAHRRKPPLADVLDIFNSLCRSYGIARYTLMRGLRMATKRGGDQIISVDSGNPSIHSTREALVLTSIKEFFGVFQQLAYGLSKYLHLKHPDHKITFDRIWWPAKSYKRGVPSRRKDIHPRLRRVSSPALSALHHLSLSMVLGEGKYSSLRELRNRLEHHIVVPVGLPHQSHYFHTYLIEDLHEKAIQIGRLARSGIWYFSGAVLDFEATRAERAERGRHRTIMVPGTDVERI